MGVLTLAAREDLAGFCVMEMHQIRYFLAVARELNFTRAAQSCHVSQPALTRAIQQLEDELGGQLMRREGKLSHLTDLGERMLPLMLRCYESALAAKSLASSFKVGSAQALLLVLARSIDLAFASVQLARADPPSANRAIRAARAPVLHSRANCRMMSTSRPLS